MTLRIEQTRFGGPEEMIAVDVELPPPGPGEVRVRHTSYNFV